MQHLKSMHVRIAIFLLQPLSQPMWDAELLLMQETGTAAFAQSVQAVNVLHM